MYRTFICTYTVYVCICVYKCTCDVMFIICWWFECFRLNVGAQVTHCIHGNIIPPSFTIILCLRRSHKWVTGSVSQVSAKKNAVCLLSSALRLVSNLSLLISTLFWHPLCTCCRSAHTRTRTKEQRHKNAPKVKQARTFPKTHTPTCPSHLSRLSDEHLDHKEEMMASHSP